MNLSYQEVKEILKEIENPEYSNPQILHLKKTRLSIFKYDKKSGLILIHGDEFVGLDHIITRHSLLSRKQGWKDNGGLKEEGTKFPIEITQRSYMEIAKTIYKHECKTEKGNNESETFDMYEGDFYISEMNKIKCRLFVYKNTGIINTLYPMVRKKKYNIKKRLNLKQSFCGEELDLLTDIHTLSWSYKNQDNVETFKVIIRKFEHSINEHWFIQKNTLEGIPLYTTYPGIEKPSKPLDFGSLSTYMDYHNKENVEWIEREINQMIDR